MIDIYLTNYFINVKFCKNELQIFVKLSSRYVLGLREYLF